ncbi:MAG TPA: hypothetical protein VE177_06245 [Candidatus Binatus sp.]|nr:hypothetical protein [Candidatus Binatus sp.]
MVTTETVILIVGLTVIIIGGVVIVRVLTGRSWCNLSKKPDKTQPAR